MFLSFFVRLWGTSSPVLQLWAVRLHTGFIVFGFSFGLLFDEVCDSLCSLIDRRDLHPLIRAFGVGGGMGGHEGLAYWEMWDWRLHRVFIGGVGGWRLHRVFFGGVEVAVIQYRGEQSADYDSPPCRHNKPHLAGVCCSKQTARLPDWAFICLFLSTCW